MSMSINFAEIFQKLLSLVGKEVEVTLASQGKIIKGTVTNAMFDSFIVEGAQGKQIVSFSDLQSLQQV